MPPTEIANNLAALRKRARWSASALATEIGISRQAIYAMEAGTYVPNTAVALQLAQTLGVGVEEIFRLESQPASNILLAHCDADIQSGMAVQLGRINGRLVAVQPSPPEWYLPASDAVADSAAQTGRVKVRVHRSQPDLENHLIIAGCDPATSILSRHLQRAGVEPILVHRNSSQALSLLKQGRVHIAGTHLHDDSAIPKSFARSAVTIVSFATWEEGLIVAPGNPKRIKTVEDLARKSVRFVNREQGAGTRLLLDNELRRLHIAPPQIRGYDREAPGHLAAALHVRNGTADGCIATEAAARAFGLTFVPLQTARYDLVMRRQHLNLPGMRALCDTITRADFRRELTASTSYDTTVTGARVL